MVTEAQQLAQELVEPLGRRWAHVQAVAAKAKTLAEALMPDQADVIQTAAWLHDIGYAKPLIDSGLHSLDGARYIARLGQFDSIVACLVAYHTGATEEAEERGFADQLRREFSLPSDDLMSLVTTADLTTGPDGSAVGPCARIKEILSRYSEGDPVHRAVSRSGPQLIQSAEAVIRSLADKRDASFII
jgi:predicted hydrolase (HD superfamily)